MIISALFYCPWKKSVRDPGVDPLGRLSLFLCHCLALSVSVSVSVSVSMSVSLPVSMSVSEGQYGMSKEQLDTPSAI